MQVLGRFAVALVAGLLVAPATAPAAEPLRLVTGGSDATLSAVTTTAGTFFATSAEKRRTYVTRIFQIRAGGATPLPQLPVKPDATSTGLGLLPREDGAVPCAAATVKSSPYVACLEDGVWRERRFTGADRTWSSRTSSAMADSLYAFLSTTDFGAFERAAGDPKAIKRFRLTSDVRRWDGAAWVRAGAAAPSLSFTFDRLSLPIRCLPSLASSGCETPRLGRLSFKRKKLTVTTQSARAGHWVDDAARRIGDLELFFGDVVDTSMIA